MFRRLQSLFPAHRKRAKAIEDLSSADPEVRASAALRLGEIGFDAGPLIVQALAGAAPPLRAQLFGLLGRISSGEGAAAAVTALSDPDPGVRTAAAEALRRIAEPKPDGPPPDAAPPAVVDESAAADLILGLRDRDLEVRLESAQALAAMRHPPAASALLAVLRDEDENKDIRGNAAIALGRIGDERAMSPILAMLEDEETEGYAAEALRAMSGGLDEMVQRLQASPRRRGGSGEHPRARIVRALGAVGSPSSIGSLFRAAVDPDPGVRIAAVRALNAVIGEMRHQQSVEPAEYARLRTAVTGVLKMLLSDVDARVRLAALEAQIDSPDRDVLVVLAADPDANLRRAACDGLGRLGAGDVFEPLARARTDDDEFVRCAALDGLGRIDDARAVPLIVESLADPTPRVRVSAVYALGPENPRWAPKDRPAVREALVRALGDEDMEVRQASLRALGRLRDPEALDALIAAVGDPEGSVREELARALASLDQRRALTALHVLESDPEANVRQAAAQSVSYLRRYGR